MIRLVARRPAGDTYRRESCNAIAQSPSKPSAPIALSDKHSIALNDQILVASWRERL
jgi:hypothetical protein